MQEEINNVFKWSAIMCVHCNNNTSMAFIHLGFVSPLTREKCIIQWNSRSKTENAD